jgi:hypothetical protein
MTRRFLKLYVLSLLLFNLAACSSMQPVNIENAIQSTSARGVDYGSLVQVRTLDNRTSKFRVTEMSEDGIGGNAGFFRFEDMKSLRVEKPRANKNSSAWTWILGALGIAALVALVANADEVSVCSPSPCP